MNSPATAAKVLVAGAIDEAARALLHARSDVDYEVLETTSEADLDARIAGLDALVLRLTPLRAETVAKADRLKVVARFGVGYDNVDLEALTRRAIPLAVVGDANAVTVAEHTLGIMIALSRQFVRLDRAVREGRYEMRHAARQRDLSGKTVLIVGFGRIGRQVAKRCAAFGMTVIAADPYVEGAEVEALGFGHVSDFRDALGQADFVTLHLPGQADGRSVMSTAEFAGMKPGASFINAARGSLVDEDALAEALTKGPLRSAGLDVTRHEPPPPDNPLLGLDNVVLTPHTAGLTEEGARRMSLVSVQNALDAIDGRLDPDLVVNKEVLKR
jgi:D-3-phosphoglycerate dehydrogenase